jgi:plasmid stabilization system protein ParE
MIIRRAGQFDADLEHQFRWYLLETGLDPAPAVELAERFADAVTRTLDSLGRTPHAGRPRFVTFSELPGIRSWRLEQPFHRFLIFYRVEGTTIFAERLLEGHRRLASDV